jgi:hypothetical protein
MQMWVALAVRVPVRKARQQKLLPLLPPLPSVRRSLLVSLLRGSCARGDIERESVLAPLRVRKRVHHTYSSSNNKRDICINMHMHSSNGRI